MKCNKHYSYLSLSNFSILVPLPKTFPPKEVNFFTRALPMPPLAPVIRIFLFSKFKSKNCPPAIPE